MRALIRQLDSERFTEREIAQKQLCGVGRAAEDLLRSALNDNPSPEMKQRLTQILARGKGDWVRPTGEDLGALRAVAVLEAIGTAPARELLKDWANGKPGERLTLEARGALVRLEMPMRCGIAIAAP
jgi:hypothetical protein